MKLLRAIKDLICTVVGLTFIGWTSTERKMEIFDEIKRISNQK